MNENLMLVLAFGTGGLLGAFFFGGLWWTVQKGLKSKRPALWFFSSMLLRTGITLTGFYMIAGGEWRRFLACLLGFVAVRFIAVKLTRPGLPESPKIVKE